MVRLFLEHFLLGPVGLSTAGLHVPCSEQGALLFGRVTNMLSDGDGLRMIWDWRGASSLKPCWKHWNVFKVDSSLAHRKPGYVEADCTDLGQFRSWSATQLYSTVDTLAVASAKVVEGTMTKTRYNELEMSLGLNYNADGILCSRSLRCGLAGGSGGPLQMLLR